MTPIPGLDYSWDFEVNFNTKQCFYKVGKHIDKCHITTVKDYIGTKNLRHHPEDSKLGHSGKIEGLINPNKKLLEACKLR